MLCTPKAKSATSLWAPEAEPPLAGQFFMLDGFFIQRRGEGQDSSSFSLKLKKKIVIVIIS